jgi:hypothetical protein
LPCSTIFTLERAAPPAIVMAANNSHIMQSAPKLCGLIGLIEVDR